jgi:hypothetical protein
MIATKFEQQKRPPFLGANTLFNKGPIVLSSAKGPRCFWI